MEVDPGQAGAVCERKVSDAGNAVANRDVGQAGAILERIVSDAGNAVANRDVGQAEASSERIVPDVRNAVGNGDVNQGAPIGMIAFLRRNPQVQTMTLGVLTDFAERRDSNAIHSVINKYAC